MTLTKLEVEEYREQGALVVPGVLEPALLRRMRQALSDLIDRSRDVQHHDDVYDLEPSHTREVPRVRRIKRPHAVDPVFSEFLRTDALLSVLRAPAGDGGRLMI